LYFVVFPFLLLLTLQLFSGLLSLEANKTWFIIIIIIIITIIYIDEKGCWSNQEQWGGQACSTHVSNKISIQNFFLVDHVTPSTRKSRHYFADSGGRSVGIVRLRTKATEFSLRVRRRKITLQPKCIFVVRWALLPHSHSIRRSSVGWWWIMNSRGFGRKS
jgi:hypothetical protein